MQSLMCIFSFLLFASVSSADVLSEINVDEVRGRLGIVEGEYELVDGQRDLCIEGRYELRMGVNTLSLFADGDIFAGHIQRERFMSSENGCASNYATRAIDNGFENREEIHCPSQRVSYVRIMNAKFNEGELRYTMQTHRVFENLKSKITCKLKLKKDETPSE